MHVIDLPEGVFLVTAREDAGHTPLRARVPALCEAAVESRHSSGIAGDPEPLFEPRFFQDGHLSCWMLQLTMNVTSASGAQSEDGLPQMIPRRTTLSPKAP